MRRELLVLLFVAVATFQVSAKNYKAAEIYSNQSYLYGRFEMRIKAAAGSGQISSFFLYRNNSEQNTTLWREIDLEIFGKDTNKFQTNVIIEKVEGKQLRTEGVHTAKNSVSLNYHTYVVEWTPDSISWYLDDSLLRVEKEYAKLCDAPMSIRFNHWAANISSWVGAFDTKVLPQYQYIDYLAYSSYVPASGETAAHFQSEWKDDFTSFDAARWSKADWTFGENYCDFLPANAYTEAGAMVLKLHDATPPKPTDLDAKDGVAVCVYPNPFANDVQIDVPQDADYSFSLYTLDGHCLCSGATLAAAKVLLDGAAAGSYCLRWQSGTIAKTGTLVLIKK